MKVRATVPGRINLIGEHTDYNEGFVLPAAIDYAVTVEATALKERCIFALSEGFGSSESFRLDDLGKDGGETGWIDYLKGVCRAFEEAGHHLSGAQLYIRSRVPAGAGLGSSAAFEVAVAAALAHLSGLRLSPRELALLCWKAENEFVGVRCGVMDQLAAALSRKEAALLLDCRSLGYKYISLPFDRSRLLIVDSMVPRTLASSGYNRRREECETAVEHLAGLLERPVSSLRDVTGVELDRSKGRLPQLLYRRSRYILEENERVSAAAAALRAGDLKSFGALMEKSHAGLRDLYEVSSPELDLIVETALRIPGVWGARMTGAGFGGCAIVLLKSEAVGEAKQHLVQAFTRRGLRTPHFYLTSAASGAAVTRCFQDL